MSEAIHETAGRTPFLAATRAQATLLLRSRRPWFLLLTVGVVIAVAVLYHIGTASDWSPRTALTPGWYTLLFVLGGVWGILVWHDEGPGERWYHWSLPLDMSAHDAARVLAGAAWLLAAVALVLTFVVVMSLSAGHSDALLAIPALAWANYATNALLGYLLLAALATLTGRALEWALLTAVGLWVMVFELVMGDAPVPFTGPLKAALRAAVLGDHGLVTTLQGMGSRARLVLAEPSDVVRTLVEPGTWAAATAIWLATGIGLFLAASAWHRRLSA